MAAYKFSEDTAVSGRSRNDGFFGGTVDFRFPADAAGGGRLSHYAPGVIAFAVVSLILYFRKR
ncbi:MAG: hypothetical protein NVS9B2_27950 [Steroidobacteraceae bacterium]